MTIDIDALKAELLGVHPVTGAYSADAVIAAAELNAENRTINKSAMTGSEVYNAVDPAEYTALTAIQQEEVWNILHLGTINPFGFEATRFTAIFGGGSNTITSLAALRKINVSRAVEISLGGVIKAGHVLEARS